MKYDGLQATSSLEVLLSKDLIVIMNNVFTEYVLFDFFPGDRRIKIMGA